ncbi:FtsX-like permease family protein [Streptomyces sp. NPDC001848]|uniref:FtsX-like permease family protein n=1 Tax=Streptomyces sp. NPDC001848 TaxID=3364618 RepID=UPI00368FD301
MAAFRRTPARIGAMPTDTPSADAPWTPTRLRAAPGAALALSMLVLVTAFLTAALPRVVDRYEDTALRDTVARASVDRRSVTATVDVSWVSAPFDADAHVTPRALASAEAAFQSVVRPPLALDRRQTVYGVRTAQAVPATDPGLPRPTRNADPQATVVAQPDLDRFSDVLDGRPPRPGAGTGTVEAAVTERTAHVMRLRSGSVIHLAEQQGGAELALRITAVVRPRHPGAAYWNAEPDLRAPKLSTVPARPTEGLRNYWHFTALVAPGAAGDLLGLHAGVTAYWHHPADTEALTARAATALVDRIAALNSGPAATRLRERTGLRGLTVEEEGLATLVAPFGRERAAIAPLIMVAAVGVGTVAVIVLLMAAELTAARRRTELVLLRARGASLRGLAVRLLGESAATAVPSAAVGLLCALLLVPTQRSAAAVCAASAVAVVASLAAPVRALSAVRTLRPGEPEELVRARPSRRRTVAELTVVLVVTGAVVALRRRGTDGGPDLLTAAAPVLVAVVAALVLLRLYPLPLRLLARPAARLRGAVLPLGVARAGRSPATAALPLLAILVALTVTSFGGAVLSGVAAGRDRAALAAVGADARVQARATLPQGLAERIRRLRGVRDVAAVRLESGLRTERGTAYDLLVVDPGSYARLAAVTGVDGRFPTAVLDGGGAGALAAVVSPRLTVEFGGAPHAVETAVGPLDVRAVATRATAAAVPGPDFVIVSATAVAREHPDRPRRSAPEPTDLYVTGDHVDGRSLRATARQASDQLTVRLRSEERAALKGTALQAGAQRVYLAAVAAGGGYCVLALLLSLLQSAPQRRTTLARLRTMGMRVRQRQWLAVLDVLPQVLLGAVGGVLTGLAVVPLLRPGVNLTALAFAGTPPAAGVPAVVPAGDPLPLVLPSAGLLGMACAVLAAQAWWTGRRGEGANLRMGDQA